MKKLIIILSITLFRLTQLHSSQATLRKYNHVKVFYKDIVADTIDVARVHKLPPAAMLAIAGLESGYGSGYVGQITGNILSLGTFKRDKELPRLYLPYSLSDKKVLFDPKRIKKCKKDDLIWNTRPKSLKRDYRPFPHAGTTSNLELLKYDKSLKSKANKKCLEDFAIRWLNKDSNNKIFRDTRLWLNKLVTAKGEDILFDKSINEEFINKIGGHPNSFNYRENWPKKAKLIMKKAGLVKLMKDIHFKNMTFKKAWKNQ